MILLLQYSQAHEVDFHCGILFFISTNPEESERPRGIRRNRRGQGGFQLLGLQHDENQLPRWEGRDGWEIGMADSLALTCSLPALRRSFINRPGGLGGDIYVTLTTLPSKAFRYWL